MLLSEYQAKSGIRTLVAGKSDLVVTGGYCGDLLSWVMTRAETGNVWFTVIGNVNSVAVSVMADLACIVLAEDVKLDDAAKEKAEEQGVAVLSSPKTVYELAAGLHDLLGD